MSQCGMIGQRFVLQDSSSTLESIRVSLGQQPNTHASSSMTKACLI